MRSFAAASSNLHDTPAQQMHDEKGADGKRRYTVAEIAETFHVSRKTIYRHLDPTRPTADPLPRADQTAC